MVKAKDMMTSKEMITQKNIKGSFWQRFWVVGGFLSLTILVGGVLASGAAWGAAIYTVNVTASVSVTAISCTMSGSGMNSHNATLSNGLLTSDIGTTTFSATCNDPGGLAIYAVGNSGDTEGTTDLISSAGSSYNIATGTATSGDTSNWAMKVTPTNGLSTVDSFSSYHAVPSNYTRVAEKASGALSGTVAVASSTYQVWTGASQMTGTYTGQVKYTLVHPSTEECPEGYTMEGGVCVAPNPFDVAFAAAGKSETSGYYTMQDMTSNICSVVATPTTTTQNVSTQLIDIRDNKVYWVSKLLDGNCWMTQNLDFNINATTKTYLTNQYTDLNSKTSWSPDSDYYTATKSTTYQSDVSNTGYQSWDLGDYYWVPTNNTDWSRCDVSSYTSYYGCTSYGFSTTKPTVDGAGNAIDGDHYQVGTLYRWRAATAYSNATDGDATDSICPKGWRLPTSNSTTTDKSFGKMLTSYDYSNWSNTKTIQNTPLFFIPGGGVRSTLLNAGSSGFYWSSMAYSDYDHAYYLSFSSSTIDLSDNYFERYFGINVRCVAR